MKDAKRRHDENYKRCAEGKPIVEMLRKHKFMRSFTVDITGESEESCD